MDPLIAALQNSASSDQLKVAVDALPRQLKCYTGEVRDLLLQNQKLIADSPTADSVTSFFRSFASPKDSRQLLRTPEIRDLIINELAPKISSGDPVENLGRALCNIVQDKPSALLCSTPESFKAILSCFHRATSAGSAQWIASSFYNILLKNPSGNKHFNDLPVVEAFSAMLPFATSDDAAEWVSSSLQQVLNGNDEAQNTFGTPTFFEKFKTIEKFGTSQDAKDAFKSVVDILQPIVDRRIPIEKSIRDATTSQEFVSVLDSVTNQSDFWPSLVDLLLSKQHLIQDDESTTSAAKFIKWCCANMGKLQSEEIYDNFQHVLLSQSRVNSLKKLVVDNDEVIDEECLKKLAENEIDVSS